MSEPNRQAELTRAKHLQAEADFLTAFRGAASNITGPTMMINGPSWELATLQAVASATDFIDGRKAREATALAGYDINPEGKDEDRRADKKLTYSGLAGIMVDDIRKGNVVSGAFVAGIMLANAVRDTKITKLRSKSELESSININRAKAAGLLGGLSVGMSPLGSTEVGRRMRNISLGASTILGIVGYFSTKRGLKELS